MALGAIILATLLFPPARGSENMLGTMVAAALRLLVGSGAWAFPVVLILCGFLIAVGKNKSWDNVGGAVTLFLIFVTWRHLAGRFDHGYEFALDNLKGYGGYVGGALSWLLRASIGTIGGHIFLGALTITGLLWVTDIPLPSLLGPLDRAVRGGAAAGGQAVARTGRDAVETLRDKRELARQLRIEEQAALAERGVMRTIPKTLRRANAFRPRAFLRAQHPEPVMDTTDAMSPVEIGKRPKRGRSPARAPVAVSYSQTKNPPKAAWTV